jgi:pseudouridine synthase
METIKISKFLSECGVASRRKSEELIKRGKIFVNGQRLSNVAERINPQKDEVKAFGKIVKPKNHVYYLLYKPVGYTTTTADIHAQNLITDLVPNEPPVWPVGRLDKNTSGLILLTNDGEFTQKLTHPKYEKEKEYSIITNQSLSEEEISKIQNGLHLDDGSIKPELFEGIKDNQYKMILKEGRKRIVRRIIEKVGKRVAQLKRVRVATLTLGSLKPSEWRKLTEREIKKLVSDN